ncbi:uncharacterized protein LOC114545807 [Perca flavescens]|uniref:uncharacterized protein LOC114545807 n=1 Tax=Perca flavescens TaxID=8167 RepID=UPI00106E8FB3|nr:uncharacterized protein LOC114545807 [Perca flavescens]
MTEIIPRWGIPSLLSSDNGAHFVNSAITQISFFIGINIKTHCVYHPQSAGLVERINGTLKAKLAKCCADTGLPWTKALPLVLMYMRMRTQSRSNLSPYEILFARPPYVRTEMPKAAIPSTALCEHDMLKYCTQLSSALSDIRKQVSAGLPKPAEGPLHKLRPGDFVVIKSFRRKNWQSRRWEGPFQILLVTHTAVKVAERSTWVHATHCKQVPDPGEVPGSLTPATSDEQVPC